MKADHTQQNFEPNSIGILFALVLIYILEEFWDLFNEQIVLQNEAILVSDDLLKS